MALLLALGLYASLHAREFYLAQKAAELEAGARLCEAQLGDLIQQEATDDLQSACERLGKSLAMRITVILPAGRGCRRQFGEPRADGEPRRPSRSPRCDSAANWDARPGSAPRSRKS